MAIEGFSYAEVEMILAIIFDARSADALPKLRARYKKLRDRQIPAGPTPTRGKRTPYNLRQLLELVLCIELAEFGLSYEKIAYIHNKTDFVAQFIEAFRCHIGLLKIYSEVLFFTPKAISSSWDKKILSEEIGVASAEDAIFNANINGLSRLCLINFETLSEKTKHAIGEVNIRAYSIMIVES